MIKPAVVRPTDKVQQLGSAFGTPVVVIGKTWLPLIELVVFGLMTWIAKRRRPGRSLWESLGIGALSVPIVVGSEWGHNFAHAAAARLAGKPMDVLRITWGTPLVVYYDLEDPEVTPGQHILRALGGPLFNALVLPVALILRRIARGDSLLWELSDVAAGTNAFLFSVALLPLPGIDGGPLLKWGLVARGKSPADADRVVQQVDGFMGAAAGLGAWWAFRKGRRLLGWFLGALAALALGYSFGLIREK